MVMYIKRKFTDLNCYMYRFHDRSVQANPYLQVNVPADEKQRPVTAVLYNSAAFYPENDTVKDLTNALAQMFISSNKSNRVCLALGLRCF